MNSFVPSCSYNHCEVTKSLDFFPTTSLRKLRYYNYLFISIPTFLDVEFLEMKALVGLITNKSKSSIPQCLTLFFRAL